MMKPNANALPKSLPVSPPTAIPEDGLERDQLASNIAAVQAFTEREEQNISRSQRVLERLSHFIGEPLFFLLILLFVVLWILGNVFVHAKGGVELDPPPFFWLQGLVGLGALLSTTVVLGKQNRLAEFPVPDEPSR